MFLFGLSIVLAQPTGTLKWLKMIVKMGMLKNKRQSVNLDITELPKMAAKGGHIEILNDAILGLKSQCTNSMEISSGLISIF